MKFKKKIAVVLALALCISYTPVMALEVNAAEQPAKAPTTAAQQQEGSTYTGNLPSLPASGGEAIAQTAINLAWPYGTPDAKYKYGTGSARDNFEVAIDRVYPNRSKWGAKPKVGASCDVFVGTTIRYSGYDSNAPRGCSGAFTYYLDNPDKWTDTGISKVKDMEPGDVIVWKKASGTKHTCIYVEIDGVGYIAEAHYTSGKYGCVDRKATDYNPGNYTLFNVYRANKAFTGSIDKGCYGTDVKYLQEFLNWAGYDCGTADGSFGAKTESALKAWQKDAGLYVDGRFGKASLAAAKTFVSSKASVNNPPKTTVQVKKAYTGKFPAISSKGLKKGSKGTQVKYVQKYLCWYGIKVKVDGKYGNNTKKAVKKFQKANGLKQDGVFGKATLKKAKSIKK